MDDTSTEDRPKSVVRKRKRRKAEARPMRWGKPQWALLFLIIAGGLAIMYMGGVHMSWNGGH